MTLSGEGLSGVNWWEGKDMIHDGAGKQGVSAALQVWAVHGVPEVTPGMSVAELVAQYAGALHDGDVVVVTSKIVSKAEGRVVRADDREAAITSQTVREVARRDRVDGPPLRIVENPLGLVMAAAGVDSSNTSEGTVLLLPEDPDYSARQIREFLWEKRTVNVAVIVSDTVGRPWRSGQTDIAIGVAGMQPWRDYRGQVDQAGRALHVTMSVIVDELAAASDVVRGKNNGRPLAVVRGVSEDVLPPGDHGPGARSLVRLGEDDLFARGSKEAFDEGFAAGLRARERRAPQ
nr:coenzyme F420-0:L-glutamate ligase [Jonesia denitrificans]